MDKTENTLPVEQCARLWPGLDHIANFLNALDTEGMTAKDVRSAIYTECLEPRKGSKPPYIAGDPFQPEDEMDEDGNPIWACEIQTIGGHAVKAIVYGSPPEVLSAEAAAVIAALASHLPSDGLVEALTEHSLYYLRSILRHMREFQSLCNDALPGPSIGSEALDDNIDWLDCFIDKHERAALKDHSHGG